MALKGSLRVIVVRYEGIIKMQPHYVNLKDTPSPKKEFILDYSNLYGGINLWTRIIG